MSMFDAWALPGRMVEDIGGTALVEGAPVRRLELAVADLKRIASGLRGAGEHLRSLSSVTIAECLGAIGSRFRDPQDILRLEALSVLPETSGLSTEMAAHVLDGMCRDWTTEVFLELLEREFGHPEALDEADFPADFAALTTHFGSGAVPGVTATSLIRALLVKSPSLVKPGLGDVVLPVLWARAIHATYPSLGAAIAVAYWPGGDSELSAAAIAESDQVVVYGSDDTVAEVRGRMREDQRLVVYPHRVGLCGLGRESIAPQHLQLRAKEAALAVATFDQRGCVSPHVIYVETGGETSPTEFAEALATELSELERELPSGGRTPEEAVAFQQLTGTLEMRMAAGEDVILHSRPGEAWAVAFDPDPRFIPSCLGRFVWVKPLGDLGELPEVLAPVRRHLQTVALEFDPGRRAGSSKLPESRELKAALSALGASRLTTLLEMPWPRAWWEDDGHGPLRILVGRDD